MSYTSESTRVPYCLTYLWVSMSEARACARRSRPTPAARPWLIPACCPEPVAYVAYSRLTHARTHARLHINRSINISIAGWPSTTASKYCSANWGQEYPARTKEANVSACEAKCDRSAQCLAMSYSKPEGGKCVLCFKSTSTSSHANWQFAVKPAAVKGEHRTYARTHARTHARTPCTL